MVGFLAHAPPPNKKYMPVPTFTLVAPDTLVPGIDTHPSFVLAVELAAPQYSVLPAPADGW